MNDEQILRAIEMSCGHSTVEITCYCGRRHFNRDWEADDNEDDLEELLKRERKNPDQYIFHNDESIYILYFNYREFVLECPCKKATSIGLML